MIGISSGNASYTDWPWPAADPMLAAWQQPTNANQFRGRVRLHWFLRGNAGLVNADNIASPKPVRKTFRKSNILSRLASLEKPLRERGVNSLALFGSALHGKAGPDSDIDLLIDVAADSRFSLVDLVDLQDFLQDRLGHEVDVVTKAGLDPLIRDRVLREAEGIF